MKLPFKSRKNQKQQSSRSEDIALKPVNTKDIYLKKEQFSATADHFMKTQPSIILKGPIFIIFLILFAAIIYSFFATVKTKVTTPIIVTGEEYLVQSPVLGSVSSIYVTNGDHISEQEPIISILSEGMLITESNVNEIIADLHTLEEKFRLLTYAIKQIEQLSSYYGARNSNFRVSISKEIDFAGDDGILPASNITVSTEKWEQSEYYNLVERMKIRLKNLWTEYFRTRKLVDKQNQIYNEDKKLYDNDVITEYQLASSHEKLLNLEASQASILNSFKIEIYNSVENLLEQRSQIYENYRSIKLQLDESIISEENIIVKDKLVIVNAKYPGEVVNVEVKSYEYVARGMGLLSVIRSDMPMFGSMYIPDSDIGKVAPGQKVSIKFEAYPYQEYGVQMGRLVSISADPEQSGGQIAYNARMAFDEMNPKIKLRYGMRGTAEVSTGEKRLIETIFAPMTRVFDYFRGIED